MNDPMSSNEKNDTQDPPPSLLHQLVEIIKQAYLRSGMNQTDFARVAGISASHFCRAFVHGDTKRPSYESLEKMAENLGFSWLVVPVGSRANHHVHFDGSETLATERVSSSIHDIASLPIVLSNGFVVKYKMYGSEQVEFQFGPTGGLGLRLGMVFERGILREFVSAADSVLAHMDLAASITTVWHE